jgi:hypothetical protein
MSAYLKVIGSGGAPLAGPYIRPHADFSRTRPTDRISKGDFLVLYAAGVKNIFAIGRVTSRVRSGEDPEWPHRLELSYIVNVPRADGVPVNDISDERELTRSVRQQTCISLNAAEFRRAWDTLKAKDAESRDSVAAPARLAALHLTIHPGEVPEPSTTRSSQDVRVQKTRAPARSNQ